MELDLVFGSAVVEIENNLDSLCVLFLNAGGCESYFLSLGFSDISCVGFGNIRIRVILFNLENLAGDCVDIVAVFGSSIIELDIIYGCAVLIIEFADDELCVLSRNAGGRKRDFLSFFFAYIGCSGKGCG